LSPIARWRLRIPVANPAAGEIMTQKIDHAAAVPALQRPSRRGLLGGLLSAGMFGGAAASLAMAGLPAAAQPLISENPDLLALGNKIEPRLQAYRAAVQRRFIARATPFPAVPEEIFVSNRRERELYDGCYVDETNIEGATVWPAYRGADGQSYRLQPGRLLKAGRLKEFVAQNDIRPRTKWGRELKKKIAAAEQYEAAYEAAIRTSGILDALEAVRAASYDLQMLVLDLNRVQATTIAGVFNLCPRDRGIR
jgi:hypothetical protein